MREGRYTEVEEENWRVQVDLDSLKEMIGVMKPSIFNNF